MIIVIKSVRCLFVMGLIFLVTHIVSGCSGIYDGEKLFFQEGCSQCHTYNGRGGRMGPDLTAVANRRSAGWIDKYIHNPQKMNPQSRMPSFLHLSSAKRKAIIRFLNE